MQNDLPAVVKALVDIARGLGKQVIAEMEEAERAHQWYGTSPRSGRAARLLLALSVVTMGLALLYATGQLIACRSAPCAPLADSSRSR